MKSILGPNRGAPSRQCLRSNDLFPLHFKRQLFAGIAVPLLLTAGHLAAADWPQYRGPNHDGTSLEVIRTNWSEEAPRQLWKVRLDPALSSMTISGGRVFTQARRPRGPGQEEFCIALGADTGAELWAAPVGLADYPNGGVGNDDGPRSTPSVAGDRVVVLSSYLRLVCLNAATGQELWRKELRAEFGGGVIAWQNAASPLVVDDLVLVNGNGPGQCLLAFRLETGELAWQGQNDGMTHATPVLAAMGGVRQAIFFAQSGLVSVRPETGAVLWRFPLNYNNTSVAASPVVAGDLVYGSREYPSTLSSARAGAVVVAVNATAQSFSAAKVWYKTNQLMNHWATPVQHNGHLYGMYGQNTITFKCVELATGTEKWSVGGFGYGSVLLVSGNVLAQSGSGDLVLVAPNPAAYTELARFRALQGKCWNVPAISSGRIYVRSTTEAIALDVAPAAPAPLALHPSRAGNNGAFRLIIAHEDGSPLDPARAARIDIYATTNPEASANTWTLLGGSMVATNGQIRFDDPESQTLPRRFYRAQQRP